MKSVSVIIPAYNEEANIKNAIDSAYSILQSSLSDFEIIVVNDGSTDHTKQILNEYFQENGKIKVYHMPVNQGFGGAIRMGIEFSTRQFIFCVPADSPMTTNLFNAFDSNSDKADVLVSYRKKKLGYSLLRQFNSWVYHWLISNLFDMNLRDYNWIHMYNRKIFDEGKIEIKYNGIFMLAEVLIKARNRGFTFAEFEVEQLERLTGIATASKFSAIARTIIEIIHYRFFVK